MNLLCSNSVKSPVTSTSTIGGHNGNGPKHPLDTPYPNVPAPTNLLRLLEVMRITGLSRSTIYSKMNPNSKYHDPSFPQRAPIGTKSIRFSSLEVYAWVNAQLNKRNGIRS